jgi:hypothetical protein
VWCGVTKELNQAIVGGGLSLSWAEWGAIGGLRWRSARGVEMIEDANFWDRTSEWILVRWV